MFLTRRLKTEKSEMFLMPSGRAFQSSTAWQTNGTIKERKGASSLLKAGLQLFWDEHKHKCKHKC